MPDWREVYYGPLGYRVRWRIGGFNSDGQPYDLELERYEASIEEWVPLPSHNVRDGFAMGLMAGRGLAVQTEMDLMQEEGP